MNFEYSQRSIDLQGKVDDFMQKYIFPLEEEYSTFVLNNPWQIFPQQEDLKSLAK